MLQTSVDRETPGGQLPGVFGGLTRTHPSVQLADTQFDKPDQSNTAATARVTTTSMVMRLSRDLMDGFMAAPWFKLIDDSEEIARTACVGVVDSVTLETDSCHGRIFSIHRRRWQWTCALCHVGGSAAARLRPGGRRVHHGAISAQGLVELHRAALAASGRDNGKPGPRQESYYGAFVLDPDGNNIEAGARS